MKSSSLGPVLLALFVASISIGVLSIPRVTEAQTLPTMPSAGSIVSLVNTARVSAGLPAFTEDPHLMQAALLKAQSLAPTGAITHTSSANGVLWWPLVEAGYAYQAAGENLAVNILDPQTLVSDWMQSPTHRANIVNPIYTDIGIGVAEGMYEGVQTDFIVEYTAQEKQPPPPSLAAVQNASNELVQLQSFANLIAQYMLGFTAQKVEASTHS